MNIHNFYLFGASYKNIHLNCANPTNRIDLDIMDLDDNLSLEELDDMDMDDIEDEDEYLDWESFFEVNKYGEGRWSEMSYNRYCQGILDQ
jgi:hypothetical protein